MADVGVTVVGAGVVGLAVAARLAPGPAAADHRDRQRARVRALPLADVGQEGVARAAAGIAADDQHRFALGAEGMTCRQARCVHRGDPVCEYLGEWTSQHGLFR